jgi:hypothetical protein
MRLPRLLPLLLVALGAACADAPTAGDGVSISELRELAATEAAERQRIALVAAESEATFDSLNVQLSLLGGLLRGVTGLLMCEPQPYMASVQVIGREGGTIRAGQHVLVIPPNALTRSTVITAERPVSIAATVRLSPHGLRFERSADLTLDYAHCDGLLYPRKRVAYTDELLKILEWPFSADDPRNEQVLAKIDHFSRYAVAY